MGKLSARSSLFSTGQRRILWLWRLFASLTRRDLLRRGACGDRRMWRSGILFKWLETPGGRERRWKTHAGSIRELAPKRQDIHYPKPRVVTITQSTETGRVYMVDEVQAISAACKANGLWLHMDGARFANACASLGRSPAELSWKCGVDERKRGV